MKKIYLMGAGIYSSLHLTIETIQAIKVCGTIYVLHDDINVLNKIKEINNNVIDCIEFYNSSTTKIRSDIYDSISDKIIENSLNTNEPIGFIVHGHPLFLVSASERLIEKAEKHSILVRTLAAVSSIDTLLVDLQIDFGYACQIYDSTFFCNNNINFEPKVPLILFQLSTLNNPNVVKGHVSTSVLLPLYNKLIKHYHETHNIKIIHSASHLLEKSTILDLSLKDIISTDLNISNRPTMYIDGLTSIN